MVKERVAAMQPPTVECDSSLVSGANRNGEIRESGRVTAAAEAGPLSNVKRRISNRGVFIERFHLHPTRGRRAG
jgi:hypothetical protein